MRTQEALNELWDEYEAREEEPPGDFDSVSAFHDEVERCGGHFFYSTRDRDGVVNAGFLDVLKQHGCTVLENPFWDEQEPSWIVFWPEEPRQAGDRVTDTEKSRHGKMRGVYQDVCRLI